MPATVWRGRIAFGLVSIPVRLHKAAGRERIRFHHVVPSEPRPPVPEPESRPSLRIVPRTAPPPFEDEGAEAPEPEPNPREVARVKNLPVSPETESPVEPEQILKGYELEKDRYVVLRPREIAALRPRTSTELEIARFVRLQEIDPIFFDASYYVTPEPGSEKPYAVLFRALQETGYAALGPLAMHGREYATVTRPGKHGLILHTLFYANEVRAGEEHRTDSGLPAAKELDLAAKFVRALAAPFEPGKLTDTYEQRIRALIESRAEAAVPAEPRPETARPTPVVDIMDALRRSLEAAGKLKGPPQTAEQGRKPAARETAAGSASAKPRAPRRRKS